MKYVKELDRRDLILAVWAAEFTRVLGSATFTAHGAATSASNDATRLRHYAENAATSADRAVEALRLLVDVKFQLISTKEMIDGCYMPWEEFVSCCEAGGFTDDDGHGELATADHHVSNVRVEPSDALDKSYVRPDWATHVCWYNK